MTAPAGAASPPAVARPGPVGRLRARADAGGLPARAVVLGLLVLVTRLPGLVASRAFSADEATLATGGRVLLDGGSLYVDLIDRKPPLPFALYGGVFGLTGSGDLRWVRLVVALLILATGLVVADEAARRWGRGAGWVAGVALVLGASALGPADAPPANFELFALLPVTLAVVWAARGRAALAGAALAVAVLCKQPVAIAVVPVAWSWWHTGRWRAVVSGSVAGAVTGLGLAAPFGVALVLEWALLGTGGYLGLSAADLAFALGRVAGTAALAVVFWGGAWLLVDAARRPPTGRDVTAGDLTAGDLTSGGLRSGDLTVGDRSSGDRSSGDRSPGDPTSDEVTTRAGSAGGRASRDRSARDGSARDDLDLWLLLAVSVVGLVPGFRFFPHYLLQVLPAAALLAAAGAVRRPARLRPAIVWGVGASVLAAGLAWQFGLADPPRHETELAAYVQAHTDPDEQVLVWGNLPELYWRADRTPAGGFTHTEFVTGYSGGRRHVVVDEATVPDEELYRDWIDRLEARPPVLVLDTAAAGIRGGEYFPLTGFDALADLVEERYDRVATVAGVPVYRLRDGAASGEPG